MRAQTFLRSQESKRRAPPLREKSRPVSTGRNLQKLPVCKSRLLRRIALFATQQVGLGAITPKLPRVKVPKIVRIWTRDSRVKCKK